MANALKLGNHQRGATQTEPNDILYRFVACQMRESPSVRTLPRTGYSPAPVPVPARPACPTLNRAEQSCRCQCCQLIWRECTPQTLKISHFSDKIFTLKKIWKDSFKN